MIGDLRVSLVGESAEKVECLLKRLQSLGATGANQAIALYQMHPCSDMWLDINQTDTGVHIELKPFMYYDQHHSPIANLASMSHLVDGWVRNRGNKQ